MVRKSYGNRVFVYQDSFVRDIIDLVCKSDVVPLQNRCKSVPAPIAVWILGGSNKELTYDFLRKR